MNTAQNLPGHRNGIAECSQLTGTAILPDLYAAEHSELDAYARRLMPDATLGWYVDATGGWVYVRGTHTQGEKIIYRSAYLNGVWNHRNALLNVILDMRDMKVTRTFDCPGMKRSKS